MFMLGAPLPLASASCLTPSQNASGSRRREGGARGDVVDVLVVRHGLKLGRRRPYVFRSKLLELYGKADLYAGEKLGVPPSNPRSTLTPFRSRSLRSSKRGVNRSVIDPQTLSATISNILAVRHGLERRGYNLSGC